MRSNSSNIVEVVDISFHWLCLKREDFQAVLSYIPQMEAQFDKAEQLVGGDLPDLAAEHFFDFEEIKWRLYKDLAFLGLVTDAVWHDHNQLKDLLEKPNDFISLDYLVLCKLLAISTFGSHFSDGYFERKIKNKTILKLLQALDSAIDSRDKF